MNVQISYINSLSKKELTNKLFFVDQSLNIQPLKKFISSREYSYVSDLLQNLDNKKNLEESIDDYQYLIKLNNLIEKKFQKDSKNISESTKLKIEELTSKKNEKKIS